MTVEAPDLRFPKKGEKVRIPKGTIITGTFPEGTKEAGRSYVVTVFDVDPAYPAVLTHSGSELYPGREAQVTWPGTGGYWHHARVSDIEFIEDEG